MEIMRFVHRNVTTRLDAEWRGLHVMLSYKVTSCDAMLSAESEGRVTCNR